MLLAANDEVEASLRHDDAGEPLLWRVPKSAVAGDLCGLSHWSLGVYATAELLTDARKADSLSGVYVANVGNVEPLGELLPHAVIAERLSKWKWPTYPKSYTTVPEEFEADLWKLISEFTDARAPEIEEDLSEEGAASLRLHMVRERDGELAKRKKAEVMAATGALKCEACHFDFAVRYGPEGEGFCEVHHLNPLSARGENTPTSLSDLAVVCSNCHRMLHRRGLLSMSELSAILRGVT